MTRSIFFALLLLTLPAAAQVPISGLPPVSSLTGTESIPLVQSGTTYRATPNQIRSMSGSAVFAGTGSIASGANFTVQQNSGFTGTGTVVTNGTTAVVGTGTLFREELKTGNTITVSGETETVQTITDDTHLVTTTWTGSFSGAAFTINNNGPQWNVFKNGDLVTSGADGGNGAIKVLITSNANDLALRTIGMQVSDNVVATSADTATSLWRNVLRHHHGGQHKKLVKHNPRTARPWRVGSG